MYSLANLHDTIFWSAAVVFLIASTLLSYSLVRVQRKPAGDTESDQDFHGNIVLEIIWTLIPVGILMALLILTFQTMQAGK